MNENTNFGSSDGLWIFALLLLMFGGNGFGYGRGGEQFATSADVQRGFDTNTLEQQTRGISYGLADVGYALNNSVDAAKDNINANLGGVKDAVVFEGRGLQNQLANCCCETQRNIDAVRFDMANYTAATQAAVHSEGEQTRAMLQQNKIEALQAQVNQLQMAQALCGVPKISTAAWGVYPYNGGGCGCNGGF